MAHTDRGDVTAKSLPDLPPVAEQIFARFEDGFELLGAYCEGCEKYFFPGCEHCSDCLETTLQTRLGSRGTIYSFTVVRTKPPFQLPQPYGVAYIDLDGFPLRVFGLLDPRQLDNVQIGAPVRLCVGPMGVSNAGQACLRPYFGLLPGFSGS